MNPDQLQAWLNTSRQDLIKRGVKASIIQRDGLSMDPDIVFDLESDTIIATICIWSGLQEAELHAVSMASDDPLVLDRIQLSDNNFDVGFQPIIQLFGYEESTFPEEP